MPVSTRKYAQIPDVILFPWQYNTAVFLFPLLNRIRYLTERTYGSIFYGSILAAQTDAKLQILQKERSMKRISLLSMAVIMISLGMGCSFFGNKTQEVTINVSPADAHVLINGETYTPPIRMMVPTTKSLTITAEKPGYLSQTVNTRRSLSKLGLLDLVGLFTILIPGIGLVSDGAYEIINPHIYFQLRTLPPEELLQEN